MLKFLVKNQEIEIMEREIIAADQIAFVTLKFVFDGDWKKFHKVVQFSQCDETYNLVLGTDGNSCLLPAELHEGAVKMSVFGYDAENTSGLRATTVPITLHIRPSGFVGDGNTPIPPTPDLYQQLLDKMAQGVDGKSAYEIAKEHGYTGTEEQWLASLKGETGATGKTGKKGADGSTAFELAKKHGYEGTEEQWLASLKGDDGSNGSDGLTAFELAKKHGYEGTEEQWLASLKGTDGINGVNGSNGLSAYEIAKKNGYKDSEEEWLKSLHGKDGITPDMSEYAKTNEVKSLISESISTISEQAHTHENKEILDTITEETFVENRQFTDWTKEQIHTLKESVENISNTEHTHENKSTLDQITDEILSDIAGISKFEETVKAELQAVKDAVEPIATQAHWHHNLNLLNGITSNKIAEWDSIAALKEQFLNLNILFSELQNIVNANSERIDVNDSEIASIQSVLIDLQQQIDALKFNGYTTVFEYGEDAVNTYAYTIGIVLNGGYHALKGFSEQYPHFCCEENQYALYYNQTDFNWDAQILTGIEKRLHLSSASSILITYQSGFTEDGEMYLVPAPSGKLDVPFTLYASKEIHDGKCVKLDFQWLQSQRFITTETSCGEITPGEYLLAWIGRSDNTSPVIRSVKVKEDHV